MFSVGFISRLKDLPINTLLYVMSVAVCKRHVSLAAFESQLSKTLHTMLKP